MNSQDNQDAHLDDNVFDGEGTPQSKSEVNGAHSSANTQKSQTHFEGEDYKEEYDNNDDELTDSAPTTEVQKRSPNRKRLMVALGMGLLAIIGIIGFVWNMIVSSNGFKAGSRSVPVPSEPIDVAEKQSNRKNQPTDYADEEQMRTMNYDDVNSIYGLALKKQEANRLAAKDSARHSPSVQRELARSQQLSQQRPARRSVPSAAYGASDRIHPSPSAYTPNGYSTSPNGRSSAYEDPYRANPTREQLLLQAGFNTVKAESAERPNYGSPQTLPLAALATAEVEDNEPIPGVVSGDQTIMNGTRVMFRTLADAKIRDRFAPKGSILIGFAQVGSNRAIFNITTLRLSTGEAVPVRLRALDPDMNEGLALQSDKPAKQQVDQATNSALSQAAGQAAWSAGYSVNQATRSAVAGSALASLGAGLASAATTGRRREIRQKLNLQDGFKVFFVRDGGSPYK